MRRAALALLALAAVLPLAGCGAEDAAPTGATAQASTTPAAEPEPAPTAPAAGSEVDATTFAAALERPGTLVLDVRTPEEYAAGHLPGAVNLDVGSPDFAARVAELDPALPYAVYCQSGNRSGVALQQLLDAGIGDAYHLAGGIGAWQAAGGEVVTP